MNAALYTNTSSLNQLLKELDTEDRQKILNTLTKEITDYNDTLELVIKYLDEIYYLFNDLYASNQYDGPAHILKAIWNKQESARNTRDDLIHLLADLTGKDFFELFVKLLGYQPD